MFDEVSCEEFYNEDFQTWIEEVRTYEINAELQVIAAEQRAAQTEVESDFLYFGA